MHRQQLLSNVSTFGSGKLPLTWQTNRLTCPSWSSMLRTPSYFWARLVEFGSDSTHSTFCTGTASQTQWNKQTVQY